MKRELWPHQSQAIEMLRRSLRSGKRRPVLQAPTGFGKTRLAAAVGALAKNKRVIFTVPALSLVDQTVEAFWNDGIRDVGVIQGMHAMTDWSRPVQVASVQTLQRRPIPEVDVVMIDECHRWFDFYASKFHTVELNAPFYSWPTIATVKTLRRQAGRKRFVYTVKVNELITHRKRMVGTKTLVRDFYFIAEILGPQLGCFLFQFPPSFRYSAAALKRIVAQLNPAQPNVVEFRHRSWWNQKVYDALKKAGIIFSAS